MTTRAPGLTAAMLRFLEALQNGSNYTPTERTYREAYEMGFTSPGGGQLTPRGQAALAAPRMTAAELEFMERVERAGVLTVRGSDVAMARKMGRLRDDGTHFADFHSRYRLVKLMAAGLTALNNMRAAMGSAEYKEQP